MNGERDIFCAALEQTSTAERAAFLDDACGNTSGTRGRIEALLRAAAAAGDFFPVADPPATESIGSHIDRYELEEQIGEGGFGMVYRARQEKPIRRTVALKIIKLGMDTRAVVARFEAERQALAMMEHPNIARVIDGGATESGRPYFVMEHVSGVPITTYCNERELTVPERLDLFLQVCRAVHHAHQKGIIHRDLKPTNILVALVEDRPVAKVIDFGIAKATREPLTDGPALTRQHIFIGTAAYMSPEQVGLAGDIDTRSDIYSLGALLYELLAGGPILDARPLLALGYAEIQRVIQTSEPPPPSRRIAALDPDAKLVTARRRRSSPERLITELNGDLDRIVLKCLEKDRARRYETTEDLARDITRYLRHEPVHARPATLGYRATKFFRRHRGGVFTAAMTLVVLAGSGTYHTLRLASERDRARTEARKAAKVSELLTDLLVTGDPFRTPSPQSPLEASTARVREEFVADPKVRAEILNAIGRVHLRRGEHDKALSVLTEALSAGREIGRSDARLAQTLSDLGVLRKQIGDVAGAVPLLEESLAIRRRLWGSEHNDVAVTLAELGRVFSILERLDRAEPLFREALIIRRRVLGAEHREVAVSLGDLAALLWQKGNLAAAEPLFAESLAMHRKTVGPDHPNVGQSMVNLAQLKLDQGHLSAAEALLRDALPIIRRSFGETHWRTARMLGHLAYVWFKQHRLDEAAATYDEALQMARATLGPDQPQVVGLAIERAQVHLARGEFSAAEPLLREALKFRRQMYAEDGWRIASTKSHLGAALMGLGRFREAEELLSEASRILKDVPGPQGRATKLTHERLAVVERARGDR